MTSIIIALTVVIAGAFAYSVARRGATPPAALFAQIRSAILELQREASQNIFPIERADKFTGIEQDQMLRQTCDVGNTIRYGYTIEESENGLIHTISSQLLKRKPEKYQVRCMLAAMLTLNECLEASGIDPKSVEFNIDRSATGTHFLAMLLPHRKHDQVMATRKEGKP